LNELDKESAISYLKDIMGSNKAMGLVAQSDFRKWVHECGGNVERKFFDGCWVISPKGSTATKRICFFIHGKIETVDTINSTIEALQSDRGYHCLFSSLTRAGLGVLFCVPSGNPETKDLDKIAWTLFSYQNESLLKIDAEKFFSLWSGHGRPGKGKTWEEQVEKRYFELDAALLESLVLNQVFYNSFFKKLMRKPAADPYDVDGFFVSYEGKIVPIEIKEKFPFEVNHAKLLGIDVGRMLMLFRICLPLDSNGLYIVKEVEDSKERKCVGWKTMTLDSMIMNCNLNLQAGGTGMTGGATQTATFPYEVFADLTAEFFSDENLHNVSEFSKAIKEKAAKLQIEVEKFIQAASQLPKDQQTRL
jgi:hypothetical protein